MNPGKYVTYKPDRRYKTGNVKLDKKGVLRGNPDTVYLRRIESEYADIQRQLNPPLVVSREFADALKEQGL